MPVMLRNGIFAQTRSSQSHAGEAATVQQSRRTLGLKSQTYARDLRSGRNFKMYTTISLHMRSPGRRREGDAKLLKTGRAGMQFASP